LKPVELLFLFVANWTRVFALAGKVAPSGPSVPQYLASTVEPCLMMSLSPLEQAALAIVSKPSQTICRSQLGCLKFQKSFLSRSYLIIPSQSFGASNILHFDQPTVFLFLFLELRQVVGKVGASVVAPAVVVAASVVVASAVVVAASVVVASAVVVAASVVVASAVVVGSAVVVVEQASMVAGDQFPSVPQLAYLFSVAEQTYLTTELTALSWFHSMVAPAGAAGGVAEHSTSHVAMRVESFSISLFD